MGRLWTRWTMLRAVGLALPYVPRLLPNAAWNAARLLAERAAARPDDLAVAYLDRRLTWGEVDRAVNRAARVFRARGVGPGDVVAILMDNRPEFLFALTGLNRLRAVGALINTNITGKALEHALHVATPKLVVCGAEHVEKLREVLPALEGLPAEGVLVQSDEDGAPAEDFASLDRALAAESSEPLDGLGDPRGEEPMCYIYTSGTTGLPKAAIVKNRRFLAAATFFGAILLELSPKDVVYVTLPFYHSNAMFAGWGAVLISGAGMALRRRFSASKFWEDVCRFDATAFVYIGELCRYLLNQPEHPDERRHRVRIITGNGLRPDIWERFQQRFGIPNIREFYGATEGNVALGNLESRPGMVGRLGWGHVIVRCDLETGEALRNAQGLCEAVNVGETGLLLGQISATATFDGYVDSAATRKKILTDVLKKGDRYFNTGDLLTLNDDGWVSFADRVGDTFRWKGENVSTNEVAEILNGAPGVLESNVYGVQVPGSEGRAGMASLRCGSGFSIEGFARYVLEELPVYQRPYFVRLNQEEMRVTGTFKHQKVDYRNEGFDPSRVSDPLYFLDGEEYVPLDAALYEEIRSGRRALR